ncbi:MAG: TRAP transporter substrate-binding protein DctP [Dehalococcoidales bacterium]|nr:TRAP transporter substrate-binding protein DctP [Dehalococcoidales bacterium]
MKKYLVFPAALLVICALLLVGCSSETTTAPAKTTAAQPATTAAQPATSAQPAAAPKTMKINYTMPKGAGMGAAFDWFAVEFEKRTNGRYKCEIYPSGTLLAPPATLDGVKKNIAQMSLFVLGINPGFPLTMLTGLPSFGFQMNDVDTALEGNKAALEFLNLPEVKGEWKDIKLVCTAELDSNILISKDKEIRVPADFKGLKIGGSGYVMEIVNKNGGATVTQMPPDMYMNLDKGVVNGSVTGYGMIHDYHIPEIVDYFLDVDLGSGMFPTIINKEFYEGMTEEDKGIFHQTIAEFEKMSAESSLVARNGGINDIKAAGKTVSPLTPAEKAEWDKSINIARQAWIDDCVKAGVSADTCEKVYADWEKIYQKYHK